MEGFGGTFSSRLLSLPATAYHRPLALTLSLSALPSALPLPFPPCNTTLSLSPSCPLRFFCKQATMGTEVLPSRYELRSPGCGSGSSRPGCHTRTPRFPLRQGNFCRHGKPSSGGRCKDGNGSSNWRRGRRGRMDECLGPMVEKLPVRNLVMEEVVILKRGEELKLPVEDRTVEESSSSSSSSGGGDDVVQQCQQRPTGRVLPLLLSKQQQVRQLSEPYSGPSFLTTPPSPTSLPFPSSLLPKNKKKEGVTFDTTHLVV